MMSLSSISIAEDDLNIEQRLKALYILRLAPFVSWPENPLATTFKICVDPEDLITVEFNIIGPIEVNGRRLELIDIRDNDNLSQCDVMYISEGLDIAFSNQLPALTISSQNHFAEGGGMIEFYIVNSKVRMKTNLQAVDKAGMKFSSKLLRLLKIVKPLSE